MGITRNCDKFLSYATTKGASFSDTILLGRQELFVTPSELRNNLSQFNISHTELPESFASNLIGVVRKALGRPNEALKNVDGLGNVNTNLYSLVKR